jgi:hypothetical protein
VTALRTLAAGNTPGRPARPVLADQLVALEALVVIGRTFAHLPGVSLNLSTVYPDTIRVHVHDDLGVFETWREALGVHADDVVYKTYGHQLTLTASTTFHAATVELTGYAPALPENGGEPA